MPETPIPAEPDAAPSGAASASASASASGSPLQATGVQPIPAEAGPIPAEAALAEVRDPLWRRRQAHGAGGAHADVPRASILAVVRSSAALTATAIGIAVVLAGGIVAAGAAVGSQLGGPALVALPSTVLTATPRATTPESVVASRPAPASPLGAQPIRSCSIAAEAADSRLGMFQGSVRNATTGEILFDHGGADFSRTASVMKVVTSAAALAVLGPDYRIPTTVVAGSSPGEVVVVGGGDITLASGSSNVYPGSASMIDLAGQVSSASGQAVTSIVLDSSLFSGPTWQPSWDRKELGDGYSSEVTALQVDGDRADPSASVSPRSDDPIGRAGQAFASALGADGARISTGVAPAGATVLGQVHSAPLSTIIPDMLQRSDNTAAEMLARLTAIALDTGNSFDALAAGIPAALNNYGITTAGLTIVDGSGLSDDNGVSPNYLTALLAQVSARAGNLGVIADGLPVAGESGTLASRFTGANSDAAGHVVAKTGWIDTGYTLAGIAFSADGTVLTFAFFALGNVEDNAKSALDTIAAATYRCGNSLSNR
jgi:D-alanyl-D-alanine carboxypeptidase/D-alanyl-D-alanine-endopeptidase (penicillin-binding protein 4)